MGQKKRGFLRLTCEEQLTELEDELQRGKVYEASLRSAKWVLHVLQEGESIFVDPRTALVETLCHELIHRRFPRLSERTVDRLAKKLLVHLDQAGLWKWFQAYNRVKIKAPPKDVED